MTLEAIVRDPAVPLWRWTRERFDALVAAGEFDDQPVELLEGVLVEVSPQGGAHARSVSRLAKRLTLALGPRYTVRSQAPLAASPASEPEPDIAVIDATADEGEDHPATAHLVIEVSATSQRTDLAHKPPIYAGAGVPEYWVVDLVRRVVVVHREPLPAAGGVAAGYRSVAELPFDAALPVVGVEVSLAGALG